MIRDLLGGSPSRTEADVVIVGAGAAGISLAVELARHGREVILLEGGGTDLEETSQELYRSDLHGLAHRGIHTGRFRVHGGTTTMWGGQILELDESDFTERPWVPASGWPIPKSELLPHYSRALELEGVAGSILDDRRVWETLGDPIPHFDGLDAYLSRWCPEPNFARLHRRALESHPRIELWLHANAVELLLEHDRATGVRCRTLSGTEAIFRARHYIFALGTIESSRFFLQPRHEGAHPWNQSGLLGRHFQDHIDSDAATIRPKSAAELHRLFDGIFLRGYKYNPKLRLTPQTQRDSEILNAGGTVFSVSDMDADLAEVKTTAKHILRGRFGQLTAAHLGGLLRHGPLVARQAYRYAVQHRAFHLPSAEIKLRVHCEQQPDSESAITLSDERDSLGLLRTRLTWCISPAELRTIRRFVEIAQTSLAGIAEIIPNPDLLDPGDRFKAHCQDSFHHMGGMRMHPSPGSGVVDTDLKLHGTCNTYICSGAVFPTSGFSNPTHTLLALAVRLAGHLAAQP